MARYNKIYAGPWREAKPQTREALASVALTPGIVAVVNGSGEFAPSGAAPTGAVQVIQDNYLAMAGTDTDIAAGDRAVGIELLPEQLLHVRVADGVNVTLGMALAVGAGGTLVAPVASTNERVVFYADEAFNNNTGSAQLVRVRPAA